MTYNTALLAQADLIMLLAEAITPDPAASRLASLQQPALEQLLAAAGLGDQPELADALEQISREAQGVQPDELSGEFHRLFEGAMVCPLNETAFVRRDKGAIIGDLCGFYRAFGFEPESGRGEKPDHLVCELQFVAILLVMLASAEARGDDDQQAVTRQAMNQFVEAHLADWLLPVCRCLTARTGMDYFASLASGLSHLYRALSQGHGWPTGTDDDIQPLQEADSPYECIAQPSSAMVDLTVSADDR